VIESVVFLVPRNVSSRAPLMGAANKEDLGAYNEGSPGER